MNEIKSESPLNVKGAMKMLNMKKLDANELNGRFKFRVLSVAQGLGGTLKKQKSVYSAWEYLNRTLAKEASSQMEDILNKVDKTVTSAENRKLPLAPLQAVQHAKTSSRIAKEGVLNKKSPSRNLTASKNGKFQKAKRAIKSPKGVTIRVATNEGKRPGLNATHRLKETSLNSVNANSQATKTAKPDALGSHTKRTAQTSKSSFNPSLVSDKSKGFEEALKTKTDQTPKTSLRNKKIFRHSTVLTDLTEEQPKTTRLNELSRERRIGVKPSNTIDNQELGSAIKTKPKDVKKPKKEQQMLYKRANVEETTANVADEPTGFYTTSRINNWILCGKTRLK